jgi:hypothetical protein
MRKRKRKIGKRKQQTRHLSIVFRRVQQEAENKAKKNSKSAETKQKIEKIIY